MSIYFYLLSVLRFRFVVNRREVSLCLSIGNINKKSIDVIKIMVFSNGDRYIGLVNVYDKNSKKISGILDYYKEK